MRRILFCFICFLSFLNYTKGSPGNWTEPPLRRILNGKAAKGKILFMAAIHYIVPVTNDREPPSVKGKYTCNGVIVHVEWVLTTAECVMDYRNKDTSTIGVSYGSNLLDAQRPKSVSQVVFHPNFVKTHLFDNLALLKLKSPIPDSEGKPISLVEGASFTDRLGPGLKGVLSKKFVAVSNLISKANFIAYGYGGSNEGRPTNRELQVLEQMTLPKIECDMLIQPVPHHKGICIYNNIKKGATTGDEGAPLVYQEQLIGLLIYAHREVNCDALQVYLNVGYYTDWMNRIFASQRLHPTTDKHDDDAFKWPVPAENFRVKRGITTPMPKFKKQKHQRNFNSRNIRGLHHKRPEMNRKWNGKRRERFRNFKPWNKRST